MTSKAQIELTAVDKTRAAFDSLNRNIQGVGDRVSTMLPMLGRLGPALAAGIGPAALGGAVVGLGALIKAQADAIDQFNDLKDATGASIENLSALDDVARRNGMSLDTVGSALVKFNSALKEGDKAGVLKALNLDVEKLKQLDPAEALRQTAVALSGFADDGNKARAVQELFGKSVREVAPLLKDLSEQGGLVAKVTTQQAEEAEKFNKQIFAMQANMNELGRVVANPLIGAFNSLAEAFRTSKREGDNLLEMMVKFSPQGAVLRAMGLGKTNGFTEARKELEWLKAQRGAGNATRMGAEARDAKITELEGRMGGYLNSNAGAGRGMGGYEGVARGSLTLPPEEKKKKGNDPDADFKTYLNNLQQQVQKTQELTVHEKLLDDIRRGALTVDGKQRERLEGLAKEVDLAKERSELEDQRVKSGRAASIAAGDAVNQRNEEHQARLKRLLEGGPAAQLELQRREMQFLAGKVESGEITPDQFSDAASGFLNLQGEIKKTKSVAEEFATSFSSRFEDAILKGEKLGDVMKGLGQDILQISLRSAVTQPIGTALGGALAGGFAGMFSFDGGGYTGPGARSGGLDGKGGFMAMLHPNETVVDHSKGQRAGGTTYITVNATDNASRGDLARAVEFGQRQAMARSRRAEVYGG